VSQRIREEKRKKKRNPNTIYAHGSSLQLEVSPIGRSKSSNGIAIVKSLQLDFPMRPPVGQCQIKEKCDSGDDTDHEKD
jgi:hypothetical protein